MKIVLLGVLLLISSSLLAGAKTERKVLSVEEKKDVEAVLSKNDLLFNALLKKDGMLIKKNAQDLSDFLKTSKAAIFKDVKLPASELAFMNAYNEKSLKTYEAFLTPLIKIVKEQDVNSKFNLFYCPMVQKSWIQDTTVNKDVRNVYAMEMLECGDQTTHFN